MFACEYGVLNWLKSDAVVECSLTFQIKDHRDNILILILGYYYGQSAEDFICVNLLSVDMERKMRSVMNGVFIWIRNMSGSFSIVRGFRFV